MTGMPVLPESPSASTHSGELPIRWLPDAEPDPAELMLTCANCGAAMDERKCKLICTCGYFLSCSDYL
jgi:hypothetical protein